MNYRSFILGIAVVLFASCTVTLRNEEVKPVESPAGIVSTRVSSDASGLVYALPKTGLRFKVEAEKVEKTRGDFYQYSERYLGLKDVIVADGVEWRIKNISLDTYGVANPDETFQIVMKPGAEMPLFSLTQDGVLAAINSCFTAEEKASNKSVSTASVGDIPYTEEMLMANSSAKMAEEAARYIYRLRESRTALLGAEVDVLPPDGEAFALSLRKIDQLESQFLSLFKGTEQVTSITEYVDLVPSQIIDKEVLFRFSAFSGVVAPDDLSGSPFFVKMTQNTTPIKSTVAPTDTVGVFFKRPVAVGIQVLDGADEVLSEEVMMGQFGALQALPASMVDSQVKVKFYPENGGLKAIIR